jgi:shikimate dehydrogenase
MLKYLGVIGFPLTRSLSPVFQQAALDYLRLDVEYQAWPTPDDALATRIATMRTPTVLGGNVTIPHKEAVVSLLDEVDPSVVRIGAVNTIVNRDGRLYGYNTDAIGFLQALREDGNFDPEGRRAVIAGAGGAARAVVAGLIETRAASITIINRTLSRANRLVAEMDELSNSAELRALPEMYASWAAVMTSCDLLVNCTSAGSSGSKAESLIPLDLIRPRMLVYDLIYHPAETPLMAAARQTGAAVLGGLPMLVYQGAASFELWTEQEAPIDIMFEAVRQAAGGTLAEKGV